MGPAVSAPQPSLHCALRGTIATYLEGIQESNRSIARGKLETKVTQFRSGRVHSKSQEFLSSSFQDLSPIQDSPAQLGSYLFDFPRLHQHSPLPDIGE